MFPMPGRRLIRPASAGALTARRPAAGAWLRGYSTVHGQKPDLALQFTLLQAGAEKTSNQAGKRDHQQTKRNDFMARSRANNVFFIL